MVTAGNFVDGQVKVYLFTDFVGCEELMKLPFFRISSLSRPLLTKIR